MKTSLRLKGLAAAILMAGAPLLADAQAVTFIGGSRFQVLTPASIKGLKPTTNSFESQWGASLATPVINKQVVRALGTANGGTDSMMCSPAPSTSAYSGKVALLYRGVCNFSAKAYEAQLGGAIAVVIVNNIPGAPVGMAAGTNGAQVTIPVLMVSDVDGNAMNTAIRAGQNVTISIGQWSLGAADDYAIIPNSSAPFHATVIPAAQLTGTNTAPAYRVYTGGIVANFGSNTLSNIVVRNTVSVTPQGGSATQVYTDTTSIPAIAPIDSLDLNVSSRFFNPVVTGLGKMTMNTRVSANVTDTDTSDNNETLTVLLSDSVYSKAAYDDKLGKPLVGISYRLNAGTPFCWGPVFYTAKGGDYMRMIQFSTSKGADDSLLGQVVVLPAFKWVDGAGGNPVDGIFQSGELTLKALGSFTYTSGIANGDVVMAEYKPLNQGGTNADLKLDNNSWYWYPVNATDPTVYVGTDNVTNPYLRYLGSRNAGTGGNTTEYYTPLYNGNFNDVTSGSGTFNMFPFVAGTDSVERISANQKGFATSVAVHVSKTPKTVSVSQVSSIQSFECFPNPAVNADMNLKWNVASNGGKVTVVVYNALGQPVITRRSTDLTGSMTLPTSAQPAGNYWVVLVTDNGAESRQVTVIR